MAGGQGGRPPGRRDNPYAKRTRRPPTAEEKKRKDEKTAATRAKTRDQKAAAKLVQAAEAAAQKANKRANFFNPRGANSRQSTKARSSLNTRPSDVAGVPIAADKGDDIQGEAVAKQPTELNLDCGEKNGSSKSSNISTSLAAASSATTFNNPPLVHFNQMTLLQTLTKMMMQLT